MKLNHSHQTGVVMVVALILLSLIAISAAVLVRSGVLGSRISGNAAVQAQALQMAEAGLRWCEQQVLAQNTLGFAGSIQVKTQAIDPSRPSEPLAWQTESNWSNANFVTLVPNSIVATLGTDASKFNQAPLCIAEEMMLPLRPGGDPTEKSFVITVRGYSAGYQSSILFGGTGSMAKVQSTLRFTTSP
jgi:Tfp pilus assembly protein PilX